MPVITIFSHEYNPILLSGIGNTCRFLVEGLLERGYDVNLITLKFGKYNYLPDVERLGKLTIYRIKLPFYERLVFSIYSAWFSWRNRDIIKKSDLIHSLDSRDAPFIYNCGKPLIVNYNDYVASTISLNIFSKSWEAASIRDRIIRWGYSMITKFVEKVSAIRSTCVVGNTKYTCSVIGSLYKIDPDKIKNIYKGIDIKEFNGNGKNKKYDILFIGGNLHKKGIQELIEIISVIAKSRKDIKCVAVGRGEPYFLEKMKRLIAEKGLNENIDIIDHLGHDELLLYYATSKLFVLPTHRDSLPQVIMEAMASRMPVLAAPVGGIPEAIDHAVSGYLIEKDNINEYVERIIGLLNNDEECLKMGQLAFKRVERQFNYQTMVESYLEIYASVIGKY